MSETALSVWAQRLRRAGRDATLGPGAPFADELGHRRGVDAPFFAWRRLAAGGSDAAPVAGSPGESPDVTLWRAVVDRSVDIDRIAASPTDGPAPIIPPGTIGAIEVWTEAELCSLHALWRLARLRGRDDLLARCLDAACWHVEHLQPDNATNHPWAIHVFVVAAHRFAGVEHELHAQTMLHNCQISLGRPDALSAHVLLDAAECLEDEAARLAR